jgi:hypothetical protein
LNLEIRDLPTDVLSDFFSGFSDPVSSQQRATITDMAYHIIHVGAVKVRKYKIELAPPIGVALLCLALTIMSLIGVPSSLVGGMGSAAVSESRQVLAQTNQALKESVRQMNTPTSTASPTTVQPKPKAVVTAPGKAVRPKSVPTTSAADLKAQQAAAASLNKLSNGFDDILALLAFIGLLACVPWFFGRYLFWRWAYIALSMQEGVEMVYRTFWPQRNDNEMMGFGGFSPRERAMFGLPVEPKKKKNKNGFFTGHNEGSEFVAINDVNFKTPFLGRLLGYGNDVVFDTAGSLANLSMDHVPNPDAIKAVVLLVKRTIEYDRMMDQLDVEQEQTDETHGVHDQLVTLNATLTEQGERQERLLGLLLANRHGSSSSNAPSEPVDQSDRPPEK